MRTIDIVPTLLELFKGKFLSLDGKSVINGIKTRY